MITYGLQAGSIGGFQVRGDPDGGFAAAVVVDD